MSTESQNTTRSNANPGPGPGAGLSVTEKAVNFGPSLKRLISMMRDELPVFALVIVMGIVSVTALVIGPKVLGKATDVIFAGLVGKNLPEGLTTDQLVEWMTSAGMDDQVDMVANMTYLVPGQGVDFQLLACWLLLAAGIYLASGLLSFGQNLLLQRAVQRSIYRMRETARAKLDRLPLSYFDRQPRGELLSRMTNDTDNISQTLQQTLGQLMTGLLTVLGVLIMMFSVSPLLALVTLATVPFSIAISLLIGKKAQTQYVAMWRSTGDLNAVVEESFTGHSLVKVFGRQREVEAQMQATNDDLYQSTFKAQFISGLMMPANMLIGNIGFVLIAVVGGFQVAAGRMPLGNIQAFIQYSRMFTQPITQMASMANLLQSGVASAERVFEILDANEMTPDARGTFPTRIDGKVEFKAIDFSYTPDQHLIEGLSITAQPGQTVAIVGPTGAGKTTLVNLLERFYEISGGTIEVDGVDISTVSRQGLRQHLGMVLQDTWLFGGTIEENIAYGKQNATRDEIRLAAKAAHVDRFVHQLPDGYNTIIDDEGSNLSSGEKQLVTIARAFISQPDILILDEATSSVDTRTELLVQEAMNRLRSGRTSFVIAHRLSTIRDADLILVMENGTIVEQGTHSQLLETKGAYYRLYQSQFNQAVAE